MLHLWALAVFACCHLVCCTLTPWDISTNEACSLAIKEQSITAENGAGAVFCYNVPYLNTSAGKFVMDVRKFSDNGASTVVPDNASLVLELDFNGAVVETAIGLGQSGLEKRSLIRRGSPPFLLNVSVWQYIGSFNDTPEQEQLQAMLTPTITLLADLDGGVIKSIPIPPTNMVAFVNGIFVNETSAMTITSIPGRTLVSPLSLFVYSGWLAAILLVILSGVLHRRRSRTQFRQRVQRQMRMGGLAI